MSSTAAQPLPNAFVHFATACDAARATSSKLQKTAVLGLYFRTLGKREAGIAARFLAAQPFPASTGRSLVMGGALVVEAIRTVSGADRPSLNQAFGEHGEIGEALSAFWPAMEGANSLALDQIQQAFEEIASTGVQEAKRGILISLLRRCGPREAVYLVKIILGDMRTGVSDGVIEMGLAEAFGIKVAAIRRARLLVGDLDAVAELAFDGALEHARFHPFVPLGYMLAQPVMTAAEMVETLAGRAAIAEDKYDGIRAQLHGAPEATGGVPRVELFSRGSGAVTHSFPDIVEPMRRFLQTNDEGGAGVVFDGEIVPMRVATGSTPPLLQTLPFSTLQRRLGRKQLSAKQLRDNPCVFVAFDLLYLNGQLLLDVPLEQRRAQLKRLFDDALAMVRSTPAEQGAAAARNALPFVLGPALEITTTEALEQAFTDARARRNEGLVVKRLDSLYTPGRRGNAWLKLKSHLPTLDVVVVAAEAGHGKRRGVLSDVTFAVRRTGESGGEELVTIGKAYTGLTDAEIAALTERFIAETLEERRGGRYRIVRPAVVLEVAFDQITRSARHDSGFALRFPRIVRIRDDKAAADVDTLERVEQIFRSPDNLAVGLEGEKRAEADPGDVGQLSLF
jgi:DNA ligase-1